MLVQILPGRLKNYVMRPDPVIRTCATLQGKLCPQLRRVLLLGH
ncbi:hypothetical protein Enr17x_02010 [Gimesia fumaroli]|uniref:Uncharacterized protein n=1 Tax=Gimesia fumaroli TaxID=2527976 RepID=A0A518I519_9PLAN|nr:hypothetical protein Enr17x_02010 [Gimesia fumaroli]